MTFRIARRRPLPDALLADVLRSFLQLVLVIGLLADPPVTLATDYAPLDISYLRGPPEPLGPSSRNSLLVFSEIMYHPAPRADGRETEYIEIYNSGENAENIGGFRLTGEISFTIPPDTILPARGFLVIAPVPADVQAAYGIAGVLGGFTNRLADNSGTLRLRNRANAVLLEVNYEDDNPWPVAADGAGHSLVLARPSFGENDPRAWAASDLTGGTPGAAEVIGSNPQATVLINEFLAHTDDPQKDFIELFNYHSQPVSVAGCILTDDPTTNKFVIPVGTTLDALGFVSFNQDQLGFALDTSGETIYLKNPAGTRILDAIRFSPQENGVSSGRQPDGASAFHRLQSPTAGAANTPRRVPLVIINEIFFNPISGDDDDEFVELHNRSNAPVNLGGWRLRDGIEFMFPTNFTIPANGYVVVARSLAQLMASYSNLTTANALGDFQGSLANGGERLALTFPDQIITTNNQVVVTNTIHIAVDEVRYQDGGRWSRWADGGGSSLELIDPRSDRRLMANWADSDESAKSQWALVEHTGTLDNGRGAINELHVMTLGAGEFLVDDLEVRENNGSNVVPNGTFESGLGGWVLQGNHVRSGLSAQGAGFNSTYSFLVHGTSGGDNGANRVETDLTRSLTNGNSATLRGRARWLRGHRDVLLRLHGNHLEAVGSLPVPRDLGTPGASNSQFRANAGPAIHDVTHRPILPAAGQSVVVTAQVDDPDGIGTVALRYRTDPSTTYSVIAMTNRGAGFYSATVPAQAAGTLIAFHVQATDSGSPSQLTQFPAEPASGECLIRFGDPTPTGNFGVYRLWMTQANLTTWNNREKLSNEPLDGTFVYGNYRVIYNAGARYRGSPFLRPGYSGPLGSACAYVWTTPEDDFLLGADELNLDSLEPSGRDPTALREVTSFWMAEQLGLPFSHQRFVHIVLNGVANTSRGIPIYSDTQQPDSAYMRSWFAEDDTGEIFKIDDWFEFDDFVGREFNENARLQNYLTTGGAKKQARYRWNWEKKFNRTLNDDYTRLFSLVDAMNAPGASYRSQVERTIEADDWLMVFALRHAVGDWDGYGYNRGKNQFIYKPTDSRWQMLLWDLDFSLGCNGGHPPSQDLFQVEDPTISRLYNHPHFRRGYLHALHRIAYGPFQGANAVPFITAKYNAFTANGVATTSPFVGSGAQGISIPDWISQRRDYIINTQLAGVSAAAFAITSNGGSDFATGNNSITLAGSAPIQIAILRVNGVTYPPEWTSSTEWTIRLALNPGTNNLLVQAFDYRGQLAGQDAITITFTGTADLPQDALVINEIMYNPAAPDASFIEIFNRSTTTAFDLSNWRINGADFTFSEGTLVSPGGYLVVADNDSGFIAAYGAGIPLAGSFGGALDNGGETLQLIKPGATPAPDTLVDHVTYEDDAPWPANADGFGPSLQLIDAAQDNSHVANWAVGVPSSPTAPQWQYVTVTGTASSSRLYVYLGSAGDVYLDDMKLVAGTVPEVGLNYIQNGDFESALTGPWTTTANTAGSAISSTVKRSGNGSLHLVCAAAGSSSGNSLSQFTTTLTANAPYTLSYWYLPSTNGTTLTVRLSNNGIISTHSIAPSASSSTLYTPGAANSVKAMLPALPLVWLNEVQPNNVTGPQDNFGDRDPWIELFNSGSSHVDLSSYYLSDNYANPLRWPFPAGTILNVGQFRLVWLDNEPGETTGSDLHASFRASPAIGSVVLTKVSGSSTTIVDYVNYAPINNDLTFGAYPDGTSAKRQVLYFATPGGSNNAAYPPTPVRINEWMAGNTSGLVDLADGDFDDWFELFNAGPTAVDLSGFTLTDDLGDPNQWTIPNGTTIPAGGYLLVWADQETGQAGASGSDLHANFRLGLEGDNIGLFAPNSDLIDSVTFGPQTNDVSQGRWPDGNSGVFQFMTNSTPRAANVLGTENNQPPVLGFIPDQSVFQGSPLTLTARATDPNVAQTKTFTLDPGAPSSAFINASSGVFTWTPTAADFIGDHFLTVRVADNGSPPLSDFQTLKITVLSPPGLEFTSIVANGDGTVTFRWASQPQRTYRVYFKTVLAQLAWSPLADVLATGTELSLTDDTSPDQQRFYYVERLP